MWEKDDSRRMNQVESRLIYFICRCVWRERDLNEQVGEGEGGRERVGDAGCRIGEQAALMHGGQPV